MPKTTNRLSQYNAFQSSDRVTKVSLPLKTETRSVSSWSVSPSTMVGGGSLVTLTLDSPFSPSSEVEHRAIVSDISKSDVIFNVYTSATITTTLTTVSGLFGMLSPDHVGWSVSGKGIPEGSTIVSVTDPTTVEISSAATETILGTAIIEISPYVFTENDPDPVALNKEYYVEYSGSTVTFHTDLEWSFSSMTSLNTSASIYLAYNHKWTAVGAESIPLVSDFYDHKSRYSLRVNPSGTGPVTISLTGSAPLLISDNGKDFSFNGKIYCEQLSTISCLITHSESASPEPVLTTVYPGRFTAFRSNVEELPISDEESYNLDISITVSGHGGKTFYITSPNLIEDFLYNSNPYVYSAKRSMPDFYWYLDSSQTNPSSPLHRLIDCMMTGARDVFDEYMRIYSYEPGQLAVLSEQIETNNTHSVLVSPDYVDQRYAPWLSQFNGHRLKKNISILKNTVTSETFTEPTELYQSVGAKESFIKWQLKNGYYGRAAGTTEALREATKQVLHYTKDETNSTYFVSITPHYQSDPFKILIQTLVNETIDCEEDGEESYAVLDAISLAKPAGYKVYHQAVEALEFRVGDRLGTYPLGDTVD